MNWRQLLHYLREHLLIGDEWAYDKYTFCRTDTRRIEVYDGTGCMFIAAFNSADSYRHTTRKCAAWWERTRRAPIASMTTRQRTLVFITDYIDKYGYAPLHVEIAAGVGVSQSSIHRHLRFLNRAGYLALQRRTPRGIEVRRRMQVFNRSMAA